MLIQEAILYPLSLKNISPNVFYTSKEENFKNIIYIFAMEINSNDT